MPWYLAGIIGASTYALHSALDVWAALLLAVATLLPARWGAVYCCDVPAVKLQRAFGVFIIISIILLSKPYLPSVAHLDSGVPRALVLLATDAVTGFFSGLIGVGRGPIMIAAIVILAGFDQHNAQGFSLPLSSSLQGFA